MLPMGFDATDYDPSLGAEDDYDQRTPKALLAIAKLIYEFAELEWAVNGAIGKILKIDAAAGAVLTKSLALNTKVGILTHLTRHVEAKRLEREFGETLTEIRKIAEVRNKLAHNVSDANENEVRVYLHGWQVEKTERFSFAYLEELTGRATACAMEVIEFGDAMHGRTLTEILDDILARVAAQRDAGLTPET